MLEIPLTRGFKAIIDDEDFELVNQYKWCVLTSSNDKTFYARGYKMQNGKRVETLMHCLIINTPNGLEIDHRNCNGLDNRKQNLRSCTTAQNQYNVGKRLDNTSGFKGVSFHKSRKKFEARIQVNGKSTYLGCFKTALDASIVYEAMARKLHGEFYYKRQGEV